MEKAPLLLHPRKSCQQLIELTPNITHLEWGVDSCKLRSSYLAELRALLDAKKNPFPSLNSYSNEYNSPKLDELGTLLALPCHFKRLDFGNIEGDESAPLLQKLLDKNKHSLVTLCIQVNTYSPLWQDNAVQPRINIPACPRLRMILFHGLTKALGHGSTAGNGWIDLLNLKGVLDKGPAALSKQFPCLTSLKFVTFGILDLQIFNKIFPQDEFAFGQITQLDNLSALIDGWRASTDYSECIRRLSKMFPNVHNTHLEEFRSAKLSLH